MRRLAAISFGGAAVVLVAASPASCSAFGSADDSTPDASSSDAPPGSDASTCDGGPCATVLGTSNDAPIVDLVVDATHVLWLSSLDPTGQNGSLYACPKTGCIGPPAVVIQQKATASLRSDGTTAYVSLLNGDQELGRIEPTLNVLRLPSTHKLAHDLAVRADGVYLLAYKEPGGTEYERSIFVNDGGSEALVAAYVPLDIVNAEQMAVTDDHVFLGAHNKNLILQCTKGACSSWTTWSTADAANVQSLANTGQKLFWTSHGAVHSCGVAEQSCTPQDELTPAQLLGGEPIAVTFAAGVLLVETANGDLFSCDPTKACAGSLVHVAHENALDLTWWLYGHTATADDRAYYWVAIDGDPDAGTAKYVVKSIAR